MNTPLRSLRSLRVALPLAALALTLALGASHGYRRASARSATGAEPPPPARAELVPARPLDLDPELTPITSATPEPELTVAPPAEEALDAPLRTPPPSSPARERLDQQRRLFAGVELALEQGDPAAARALLAEHSREFSDDQDWTDWRQGFSLIVDCLEHPGPASAAAGHRFVEEERGSTLRRRVRRACLLER